MKSYRDEIFIAFFINIFSNRVDIFLTPTYNNLLFCNDVSREAADLILLDDNFSTIVKTIEDGRRIYDNIRKAIGYVFAIHIPIALASLIGLILGILPENLFLLPLHIVLMELLIDSSCEEYYSRFNDLSSFLWNLLLLSVYQRRRVYNKKHGNCCIIYQ